MLTRPANKGARLPLGSDGRSQRWWSIGGYAPNTAPAFRTQQALRARFLCSFLTIEFMFERSDLGSNFFNHF